MNQLSPLAAEKIAAEPTVTGIITAGDEPIEALAGRGSNGRFTVGCKPGPGRPRKPQKRGYVEDGWLYFWSMEFEKARVAWESLVERMGPVTARKYLAEIEAEHGQIKFRGLALEAIAAAEAKPAEIKTAEHQPSRRRRAAKKKGSSKRFVGRKNRSGRKFTTETRRARRR
jgi:hypothetical protein